MESPRYPTPWDRERDPTPSALAPGHTLTSASALSPSKSSAKGLEKLIQELKLERQKCTNALQEKSKLKIENEKLKQLLNETKEEIHGTELHNQQLLETFHLNEKKIYELEENNLILNDELNQLKKRYMKIEEEKEKMNEEMMDLRGSSGEGRGRTGGYGEMSHPQIDELESIILSKNSIIQQLENDIKQIKKINENNEKKLLEVSHALDLKTHEEEDLRSLHVRIEEMTSSHHRLQQTCEELREELESSMKKNSDLAGRLKEVTELSRALQNNEQKYKMEISQLVGMTNKYKQEIADYELIHMELNQRIEAEMETTQISQSLAHDAMKSKESYEKQIDILKSSYDESLKRYEELEESCNELRSQNLTLHSELSAAREEISDKEILLKESEEYKIVASEVHQLRAQLLEIRKKIIYNNYTEEMTNAISTSAAAGGNGGEGSQGSRRVYESIIEDLRNQLEKITNSYDESQRKISEMRTRVMKLEELEEELELYKETAKKVALENQSVVSSINEAHERNERTTHEMTNRLRDLKAAESEVYNLTIEKERMIEEMEAMKSRVREMMLEKLSAERKMSEAIARNTRNESTIDNWKLRAEKAELELGRKERIVHEQQIVISDLKAKRAESDRQRLILLEKSASAGPTVPSSPHPRDERREEELELIQLRQIKEILEKELSTLKKSLKSQKDHNNEQLLEIKKLHEEMALLKKQKELFQMDLLQQQSTRTEHQLNELRKDISETTLNWEITEQNNQRYQEIASKYQELIRREQEKVVLLETQNHLLEERMEMMKQELSIFRSLDIYEATIASEMRKYHESKSPSTIKQTVVLRHEKKGRSYQSADRLLSSDEEEDDSYHHSNPLPAPVPMTATPTARPSPTSRSIGSRLESRNVPSTTWHSEMKGDDDDEEEVGPELILQDISQSPPVESRVHSLRSSAVQSTLPQDSKQITPSLTRNMGADSRDHFSSAPASSRDNAHRSGFAWKPSPAPSLLNRQSDSRKEISARVSKTDNVLLSSREERNHKYLSSASTGPLDRGEVPAISTSPASRPTALRAGGLLHSSRPSKDEFERAKRLLAKR